ncbi:MAG: UDP-N-acetylmuramate dehydrogenase [Syntrophaceticus schinkii]|jgi:UDP-N-acetylmuramate dehydrogenase|nr:UDP-N-acetylmuramate dehydrogenase [Syntrophaceticus schinkii]
MNWQVLAQQLEEKVDGRVFAQVPMKNYTTWRVGGPADLLVIPWTTGDVKKALLFAQEYCLPLTVIGNGSNLLVLDGGVRGLVIKLGRGLKGASLQGEMITAEGGVMLPALARMALKSSLSGLEFAAGIPATVGGGIIMNAGAFGKDIGSLVQEVETIDHQGKQQKWLQDELSFSYRSSSLKGRNLIILRAVFRLTPALKEDIAARMEANLAFRCKMQPTEFPSAGSVFRNPPHDYAGRLIEEVGLKGHRIGDAAVSPKHANFIVNCGSATAREILELIKTIQEQVSEQKGIMLAPEVLILGEEG